MALTDLAAASNDGRVVVHLSAPTTSAASSQQAASVHWRST